MTQDAEQHLRKALNNIDCLLSIESINVVPLWFAAVLLS
jgi:hypothetical protein